MIITCPACDAQYLLPDDAVGPNGRRVKCTTCAHVWTSYPDAFEEIQDTVFEPDFVDPFMARRERMGDPAKPVATITQAAYIAPAPMRDMVLKTAGVTLLLLALTFGSLLAIRHAVVGGWPAAALLYETVGFPAPAPGANLQFKDVIVASNEGILDVSGKLTNASSSNEFLPVLRIQMNGGNQVLKNWDINLYNKTLPPGKEAGFKYSLKEAPADGESVTLFFVD